MNYRTIMFAFTLAVSVFLPLATSQADRVVIAIGDRPYYTHGPWYMRHGHRWCWVPGHWNRYRTHWIQGHYRHCY